MDHAFGDCAVRSWALDGVGAAVAKHEGFVYLKFIALGVAAKIIVVLEDQHARRFARGLVKEARRGEAADAAAYHDQVVGFARAFGLSRVGPECAVAQTVGHFKLARVAAAQSMCRGWIV